MLSSKKMQFLTGLVIFADIVIFFVTCGLRPKEWVRHGTGIRHASRARARTHAWQVEHAIETNDVLWALQARLCLRAAVLCGSG